jgi:hypothetical protein
MALFVSRFSPVVTASDIEKSLKEQLKLASPVCMEIKIRDGSNLLIGCHYFQPDTKIYLLQVISII